jgi:hypothetical protein
MRMTTREIVTAYIRAIEAHAPDEVARHMHSDFEVCSVIELKDGKVWRQEQYDCFA